MRGEKMPAAIPTPISVVSRSVPLSERHPEAIQVRAHLVLLAAQMCIEYVIKFPAGKQGIFKYFSG
jgi:hypothetical protein